VLQFLLGLSDRQAAEAVRCRIDFKYALATELDDLGFHHSVLADFRDRLSRRPPTGEAPPPRPPTAFQNYLDQHQLPRPSSWRSARD
jgi:hypothetical protein